MNVLQNVERVSQEDFSDNYVFQRFLFADPEAAKMVFGAVLKIGVGEKTFSNVFTEGIFGSKK